MDTTAVVAAMTTAATDTTGLMLKLLVPALGIFALQFGIRKGLRFFKSAS